MLSQGSIVAASQTHPGYHRSNNEDRLLLDYWPERSALVAVIADGIGGLSSGEVAAQIAVTQFGLLLQDPLPDDPAEQYRVLYRCFEEADRRIRDEASTDISLIGMAATVIAAIIVRDHLIHLYAGDCRLYHFRAGHLLYASQGHSLINWLVESGQVAPQQAANHPMRSVVSSSLGGHHGTSLRVDPVWTDPPGTGSVLRKLESGDTVLLCSDGLSSYVEDERIENIVQQSVAKADLVSEGCLNAALKAGGRDNISVIAVCV